MKRLLRGTLRLRNSPAGKQIQNGRPTNEIPKAWIVVHMREMPELQLQLLLGLINVTKLL